MGIKDWLRMATDVRDSYRHRNQMQATMKELRHDRNRIYEMVTGDPPTIPNIHRNGHEGEIENIDEVLHDAWAFYSIGGRPEAVYSVNQILPSGEIRVVVSQLPHKFDAELLQMLFIVLDKKQANYEVVEGH